MLRVVLDTNVLVSAFLFGGKPAAIVHLASTHDLLPFTSPPLLEELERVLQAKFHVSPQVVEFFLAEWRSLTTPIEPHVKLSIIHHDPSDNRVLECAVSARVDVIVSGDKHLLNLKVFRTIPILSPAEFLSRWRPKKP